MEEAPYVIHFYKYTLNSQRVKWNFNIYSKTFTDKVVEIEAESSISYNKYNALVNKQVSYKRKRKTATRSLFSYV